MSEQFINTIGFIVACFVVGFVVVMALGVVAVLVMARLGIFDCFNEV